MKIRYAKQSDFDFLMFGLEDNRIAEGRPKKDIPIMPTDRKELRKGIVKRTIRVIEKNGEPIGFIHFIPDFRLMHVKEKFFWIDLIYVKKGFRREGIGKALYKDVLSIAKKKGFKKVYIDIFEVNKDSKRFHRKLGFEKVYAIYEKRI